MATENIGGAFPLTTTAQTVLSTGANEAAVVVRINADNTDTVARLVTLYQVPDAGTAGSTNQIHRQTVYAGQSSAIDIAGLILSGGQTLQAKIDSGTSVVASVNAIKSDQ